MSQTASTQPHTCYLVCATARTGYALLCDSLLNTGVAGVPEEYLVRESSVTLATGAWRELDQSDTLAYLRAVIEQGTTPNGVFGSKITLPWLEELLAVLRRQPGNEGRPALDLFNEVLPQVRFIWVTRRDKVRQAVSSYRAIQTQTWVDLSSGHAAQQPYRQPTFSYYLIEQQVQTIVSHEAEWADFFAGNGIAPYTVVYEDLVLARAETLANVLRFIGLDPAIAATVPAARTRRQADTISEAWVQRYHQRRIQHSRMLSLLSLPAIFTHRALFDSYGRKFVARRMRALSAVISRPRRIAGRARVR